MSSTDGTAPPDRPTDRPPAKKMELGPVGHLGDRLFAGLARGSGGLVVLIVAFVGIFLLALAIPALANDHSNFLFSRIWEPGGVVPQFGIAALFYTTLISSIIAMVDRGPDRGRGGAVHHVLRAEAAGRAGRRTRSTCWRRSPRSSTACGASCSSPRSCAR